MTLTTQGLNFAYNGKPILDGIDFSLEQGRIMAILGVNGAGKTTLLKCLNRILKPKSGIVSLGGVDLTQKKPHEIARIFGYSPQQAGKEDMTVFEAVLLGRKPHVTWSATEDDLRITNNNIQLMGLSEFAHRPASRLSGGELQKVLIARALTQEPDVLLLDEPTSSLDIRNQIQVMKLVLNAVRQKGITAIVTLHDINLAFRYADQFLLMKDGKVLNQSTADRMTPDTIKAVYGIDVVISQINDHRIVVPIEAME